MAKPYSQDLRDRVIDAVKRGKWAAAQSAPLRDQRICGDQMAWASSEMAEDLPWPCLRATMSSATRMAELSGMRCRLHWSKCNCAPCSELNRSPYC